MPGDDLESVTGQLARRDVVAAHRVHGVDQLAPRRDESHTATLIGASGQHAAPRRTLAKSRHVEAAERQRDAKDARAPIEEGEVEAVQVVVLDRVGVIGADSLDEPAHEVGLGGIGRPGGLEDLGVAGVIANRDHEDAIARGIETRGLQIELEAPQLVERKVAEVRAPRHDEILLLRREREHAVALELTEMGDALTQPLGRP